MIDWCFTSYPLIYNLKHQDYYSKDYDTYNREKLYIFKRESVIIQSNLIFDLFEGSHICLCKLITLKSAVELNINISFIETPEKIFAKPFFKYCNCL